MRKRSKTDAPKAGSESAALSREQGIRICELVFPTIDRSEGIAENLEKSGFAAFRAYERWSESYCQSERELETHRRYRIDHAKELLAGPLVELPGSPMEMFQRYRSPFLQKLRRQRDDENGMPLGDLKKHYPLHEQYLRTIIDPSERHYIRQKQLDPAAYDAHRAGLDREQRRQLDLEVRRHATDIASAWGVSQGERCGLFLHAATRYGSSIGFSYIASKSAPKWPAIVLPIDDEWDLRWVVKDSSTFECDPGTKGLRFAESHFEHQLLLCAGRHSGNLGKSVMRGEYLRINFSVVPFGFIRAYRTFRSNQEFETIIKAHVCLLGLMIDDILAAIKAVLRHV